MRGILLSFFLIVASVTLGAQAKASDHKGDGQGPCQSVLRCQRLEAIARAESAQALQEALNGGCDGYPEQAIAALRGYQLKEPGAAATLIGTMPRGLGDITALLYMTAAPYPETAPDFQFFLQAGGPQDQIPRDGCPDDFDPHRTMGLFAAYLSAVSNELPSRPQFIPRFLEITQFFGQLESTRYFFAPHQGYSPIDPKAILDGLLRELYRRNPTAVRKAARFTVLGKPALAVAQSAAPRKAGSGG
jgi:hypothetical protein